MKHVFVLFCIVFLTEIATDIFVPVLPLFENIFHANIDIIQLTMSLHLIGFALAQPIYGLISDYYGRRRVLLTGFGIFLITTFLCALSPNIYMLILFRFLQGIGASSAPVLGMSIIKDRYAREVGAVKMLSLMSMAVSLSPIIGPIWGTVTATFFGWAGCFYFLLLFGSLLFPLLYVKLEETLPERFLTPHAINSSKLLFLGFILINGLCVACVWVFITAAPFILMQKYHVQMLHYGFYQAFTVLAYMAGGLIANRCIDSQGARKLVTVGLWVITTGSLLLSGIWLSGAMTAIYFVCCVALMNLGIGIYRPPLINRIMDCYDGKSGFAAGVLGMTEMVISALAITTLGIFCSGILEIVIGVYLTASLSALFIFYLLKPKYSMGVIADT